jgi:hypothetical protein
VDDEVTDADDGDYEQQIIFQDLLDLEVFFLLT